MHVYYYLFSIVTAAVLKIDMMIQFLVEAQMLLHLNFTAQKIIRIKIRIKFIILLNCKSKWLTVNTTTIGDDMVHVTIVCKFWLGCTSHRKSDMSVSSGEMHSCGRWESLNSKACIMQLQFWLVQAQIQEAGAL